MAGANLSGEIYERLSERILKWEYPPGHRLTEKELCEQFSVSRSPIREALGKLVECGLVDKKDRHSYAVRRLDLEEINELYDVRIVLEVSVMERLCKRGMAVQLLGELESQWRGFLDRPSDLSPDAARADEEFHEILAREAGNGVLLRLIRDIDKRIHFVRLADIVNPERLKTTCGDHLAMLDSIRRMDARSACETVRRNIEWGRVNVESAIKDALVRAYQSV